MSYEQHQSHAQSISARCAIVTLSDTRKVDNDVGGKRIAGLLTEAGHTVVEYRLIPDDAEGLRKLVADWLGRADVEVILTTGGTGISRRDQAVDAIEQLIESPLPGFGELFRMLSWEQIGSGALMSRAVAGIARGKVIFAMPGSPKAVELAMTKLIVPEIKHILGELRK